MTSMLSEHTPSGTSYDRDSPFSKENVVVWGAAEALPPPTTIRALATTTDTIAGLNAPVRNTAADGIRGRLRVWAILPSSRRRSRTHTRRDSAAPLPITGTGAASHHVVDVVTDSAFGAPEVSHATATMCLDGVTGSTCN